MGVKLEDVREPRAEKKSMWMQTKWPFGRNRYFTGSLIICSSDRHFEDYDTKIYSGRNSSVGIAIRYGLDGPGIESR